MGRIATIAILIVLGVYLVIAKPILNSMAITQMDDSIKTDKNILKRFLLKDEALPSKALYEGIETEQKKLENNFKQLVSFLDSKFDNLPHGPESGLFFKESVLFCPVIVKVNNNRK